MNAIQIESLSKRYDGVQALNGLNMEVKEGSVYGFLGPNGAGKTTTLRLIVNLARPGEGQVKINGTPVGETGKTPPQVGYLPEEPAFYPWMTPLEFLDYVGRIFHLDAKKRKERVAEMIELSGLKEAQKRKIAGFSRGMRQRLGIVQALMNRPGVLLLDEPVSALDPAGRKEVLDLIESLRGRCTILMSTHILADVERVCDAVGIINKGRMIIQSERAALLERYAVSALELELANGEVSHAAEIAAKVKALPGVDGVNIDVNTLHINAANLQDAQRAIMQQLLNDRTHFERLEVVRPSLEDVFIQLTSESAGAK